MAPKTSVTLTILFILGHGIITSALSQDLYVGQVTATPVSGNPGDQVTIQARIGNNGPGTAFAIQLQWFLSEDPSITPDDMALTPVETPSAILYQGQEITLSRQVTIPAFQDVSPPSYLGVIVDPYGLLPDDQRENNSGASPFTITGVPAHGFFDTTGDNYLDITHVSAWIDGANLNVAITFREPPADIINGFMAIDLDQDPTTRMPNSSMVGAEAIVNFLYQEYSPHLNLQTASGTTDLTTIGLDGNVLTYSIPLDLLGNPTSMDLYWAVNCTLQAATDFDRAPDIGVFATDSGNIVVRRPGNNAIHVDIADPVTGAGEPEFPNVRRMEVTVPGDQMEIVLTYDHQVENLQAYPGGHGLFVWIDLDPDYRLCTGFKNTEQRPPSFGIDYGIEIQADPLAGTSIKLLRDEDNNGHSESLPVGIPYNDIFVRLSGNRLICRIPLGYLGFIDGNTAIAVSNLDTRDILSGTIDRVPDTGAWDSAGNAYLPIQACRSAPVHLDDPPDDSIGAFGLDNDEITGITACTGDGAFLFTIDYKSYSLTNDGATLIYIDTDHDTTTGWPITNIAGDTAIGADYIFRTYWHTDSLMQITKILKAGPAGEVWVKNQLTTITLANRLYTTIPFDCIGNPQGPVDILVETASWGGGPILLPNDDVPDSGVITLNTVNLPGDYDHDGDIDGKDLAQFLLYYNLGTVEADLNKDQVVNGLDARLFAQGFGI